MDAKDWIGKAVSDGSATAESGSDDSTFSYLTRDEETSVVVREAVEQDAAALAAVGARAFQHAHASVLHPLDLAGDLATRFDERELRRELRAAASRWLIALWNGEAVGLAQLETDGVPMDSPGPRPVQLRSLYVAPDWSGNGVGSALIEASSKLAAECGYERIWVRVWAGNRDAIAFLRSWRFERVGYEVMALGRSSAPVLVLSRPLATVEH